jgi:hypothetical protein
MIDDGKSARRPAQPRSLNTPQPLDTHLTVAGRLDDGDLGVDVLMTGQLDKLQHTPAAITDHGHRTVRCAPAFMVPILLQANVTTCRRLQAAHRDRGNIHAALVEKPSLSGPGQRHEGQN